MCLSDDRELGIRASIYLKANKGVTETVEQAGRDWDSMSRHDRLNIIAAYEMFQWAEKNNIKRRTRES